MNIILAEERPGGPQSELSFSKTAILVGRNAVECDIAFSKEQFPMVSRKHAELRWENGRWYLADLDSTYGTYLNDRRVTARETVKAGDALRFGTDGPVVRVVWFEVVGDWEPDLKTEVILGQGSPLSADVTGESTPSAAEVPLTPRGPAPEPAAETTVLEFADGRPAFPLIKPSIWLGRDLEGDVVFDASAIMVSRRHAEIRKDNEGILLTDNNSFNGTLVNGQRISAPVRLFHNDQIQLGMGGPLIRLNSPSRTAVSGEGLAGRPVPLQQVSPDIGSKTMVFKLERPSRRSSSDDAQLLMSISFGDKDSLSIGRDDSNDIRLDGLQISKHHARLTRSSGDVIVEDKNSTNGVFVNGMRVGRQKIELNDSVQIGSFMLRVDETGNIAVFDTRSKHRLDAIDLSSEVKDRGGRGRIKLLDSVSLSIQPNEFVGLIGPSGAGKSTLIEALNGARPAQSGKVLINNLDLYHHIGSLKQSIGYVPQEDIIHRELSVYRTLYYVAKLRLSDDVSRQEVDQIVNEVLDVTGLGERRHTRVKDLSGGQRKRVSIAVELITKPSVIFLDEPTSGLDPGAEARIMRLFRQIAESGRTVVMTTHAMENVGLFDKIVILMRGKLVFYGAPDDALKHLQAESYKELFDRLEAPVEEAVLQYGESGRSQVTESIAEDWRQKYARTPQFRELLRGPLTQLNEMPAAGKDKKRRLGPFGSIRQWLTLTRRYFEVLFKDKLTLLVLLAQAPAIALLTYLVTGTNQPRDFIYFVIALVAVWFGTSVSAREIIRERPVYKRERMFNLGIIPYLGSKLCVLSIIVGLQCLLLFVPLKLLHFAGVLAMPGEAGGIPQFWAMLLTAAVGIATGLLISAMVKTSEMATSLVPLILIPQLLFSGLAGVPSGVSRAAGMLMPATWSFDTMKRFSTLDTLSPEGANPRGKTKGLGLYKYIEAENQKVLTKAREDLETLQRASRLQFQEENAANQTQPELPDLGSFKKLPEDLSGYVTFLHPWMNEVLNQIVLMLMFGMLVFATLIVLRLQDIV